MREEAAHDASPETAEQHFKMAATLRRHGHAGRGDEGPRGGGAIAAASIPRRRDAGEGVSRCRRSGSRHRVVRAGRRSARAVADGASRAAVRAGVRAEANGEGARALAVLLELQAEAGEYRDVSTPPRAAQSANGQLMLKRLLLVAYFIEVGLLLVLVPWSPFWERNYFLDRVTRAAGNRPQQLRAGRRVRPRRRESADGLQRAGVGTARAPPYGDDGNDRAVMICLVTDRRRLSTAADGSRSARRSRGGRCARRHRSHSDSRARSRRAPTGRAREAMRRRRSKGRARRCSSTIAPTSRLPQARTACICAAIPLRRAAARSLIGDGASSAGRCTVRKKPRAVPDAGGVDYLIFGTLYQTASKSAAHPCRDARRTVAQCRAGGRSGAGDRRDHGRAGGRGGSRRRCRHRRHRPVRAAGRDVGRSPSAR